MRNSLQIAAVWATAALATAIPLTTQIAKAWGPEGHMIVATIAEGFLNDKAKSNVARLLSADKDALSDTDFAGRAVWADSYRDSDRNTTKKRYNATREWHFVDINIDKPDFDAACFDHPPLGGKAASWGPAETCVADKIEQFRTELANPATSKSECIRAFKFLLHFVGDLHQPLHAADRKDSGGNTVLVFYDNNKKSKSLHSYWDSRPTLIGSVSDAATELTKEFGSKKGEWMAGKTSEWAQESFKLAKKFAYDLPSKETKKGKQSGFLLSDTYEENALKTAREQLAKGGIRLAMILNETIGGDKSCVTPKKFP
jgi:hypothetical protein